MKEIIVTYRKRSESSKALVKNNLQWYDPIKKELLKFEGGQLEFEYKEDEYLIAMGHTERFNRGIRSTYRLLPKIADLEIKSTRGVLDDNTFMKFFDGYLNYNISEVIVDYGEKGIATCHVPDKEVDDFSYELERRGFYYEIQ